MMAHALNPSSQKAETGGSLWIQGQPVVQSEFPGQPDLQRETLSWGEKQSPISGLVCADTILMGLWPSTGTCPTYQGSPLKKTDSVPQKVTDNRLSARVQSSGVLQPFHAGMMTGFKSCAGINGCCQYMRAKILSYPEDTVASWYPWLLTLAIVLAPLLRCPSNLGGLGVLVFIVSLTQLIFTWKIEPQLINYPDQTGLWPCV